MAAPASQFRPRREEIEFAPNLPVTVAIRYNIPKMVSGMSGERCLFTTPDNRVFFTSPEVAGQIEAAGIQPNQPFTITKRTSGKHGEPVTWEVSTLAPSTDAHRQPSPAPTRTAATVAKSATVQPQLGPQSDGTFAVPADAPRDEDAPPSRKGPQSARTLIDETNSLVDAYATVLDRALRTYQGRVKPDEVRALLITSYIQTQRRAS